MSDRGALKIAEYLEMNDTEICNELMYMPDAKLKSLLRQLERYELATEKRQEWLEGWFYNFITVRCRCGETFQPYHWDVHEKTESHKLYKDLCLQYGVSHCILTSKLEKPNPEKGYFDKIKQSE